jgi:hypothetical protein
VINNAVRYEPREAAVRVEVATTEIALRRAELRVAAVDLTRAQKWSDLGIWVGADAPVAPCTYAQWAGGTPGYWGWIEIP